MTLLGPPGRGAPRPRPGPTPTPAEQRAVVDDAAAKVARLVARRRDRRERRAQTAPQDGEPTP